SPRINFLGVDLSRDVLGVARRNIEKAYAAQNRPVDNIALAAHNIEQILLMMDRNDAVERIYINFCNPWPKEKHHKRRLTHPRQLRSYQELLAPGGEIHFKTDDDDLYRATLRYFR
ncbi:MAG TPA: tRNA (guanosine(46)-N7)-methyltransferase TrmB, partial [Ruminococcaceae bacterium]|nr:tRNA (guanosine(46)-N7)-methyltransferase TrmB [Oscillospiraceae bacterium]